MLRAPPRQCRFSLQQDFTELFEQFLSEWTGLNAALAPEGEQYRGIFSLLVVRKLWRCLRLAMVPTHRFRTAFVNRTESAKGMYTIVKACELPRE